MVQIKWRSLIFILLNLKWRSICQTNNSKSFIFIATTCFQCALLVTACKSTAVFACISLFLSVIPVQLRAVVRLCCSGQQNEKPVAILGLNLPLVSDSHGMLTLAMKQMLDAIQSN